MEDKLDTKNQAHSRPFNPVWAIIFFSLTLLVLPGIIVYFIDKVLTLLLDVDWLMSNPVEYKIFLFSKEEVITSYPILHSLNSVITAPFVIWFVCWRMRKRNINISKAIGLKWPDKNSLLFSWRDIKIKV